MSFSEVLREVTEEVKGAKGAAISGMDGIVVEHYMHESGVDLQSVAAEYGNVLKVARNASQSLGTGPTTEFAIVTDGSGVIIRKITEDYFMVLLLGPGAALGKGRFLVRRAVSRLKKEF